MREFPENLELKLAKRAGENSLRVLKSKTGLIDFTSNDYLGFTQSSIISERSLEILDTYNVGLNGSGGSRLLRGQNRLFEDLENEVAFHHNAESALVFGSGFAANIGLLGSVPQRGDLILFDELVHASIREGILISNAESFKFKHNDLKDLEQRLSKSSKEYTNIYVVTETVFSMDGDGPDLNELVVITNRHHCYLILDEAHAVGLSLKGRAVDANIEEDVFARIVTFGKALGSHGAAVLGSHKLIEFLVNFARSFVYSTAAAPHSVATSMASYETLNSDIGELERGKLQSNIVTLHSLVEDLDLGILFITSESPIQSYLVSGNEAARKLSTQLEKEGFDVRPILAPTVPAGSERLRICIHSFNTVLEIERLLTTIKAFNA